MAWHEAGFFGCFMPFLVCFLTWGTYRLGVTETGTFPKHINKSKKKKEKKKALHRGTFEVVEIFSFNVWHQRERERARAQEHTCVCMCFSACSGPHVSPTRGEGGLGVQAWPREPTHRCPRRRVALHTRVALPAVPGPPWGRGAGEAPRAWALPQACQGWGFSRGSSWPGAHRDISRGAFGRGKGAASPSPVPWLGPWPHPEETNIATTRKGADGVRNTWALLRKPERHQRSRGRPGRAVPGAARASLLTASITGKASPSRPFPFPARKGTNPRGIPVGHIPLHAGSRTAGHRRCAGTSALEPNTPPGALRGARGWGGAAAEESPFPHRHCLRGGEAGATSLKPCMEEKLRQQIKFHDF